MKWDIDFSRLADILTDFVHKVGHYIDIIAETIKISFS